MYDSDEHTEANKIDSKFWVYDPLGSTPDLEELVGESSPHTRVVGEMAGMPAGPYESPPPRLTMSSNALADLLASPSCTTYWDRLDGMSSPPFSPHEPLDPAEEEEECIALSDILSQDYIPLANYKTDPVSPLDDRPILLPTCDPTPVAPPPPAIVTLPMEGVEPSRPDSEPPHVVDAPSTLLLAEQPSSDQVNGVEPVHDLGSTLFQAAEDDDDANDMKDTDYEDYEPPAKRTRASKRKSNKPKFRPGYRSAMTFPCLVAGCEKSFTRNHDVKRHVKLIHNKVTTNLPCLKCGALLSRPDGLNRHLLNSHRKIGRHGRKKLIEMAVEAIEASAKSSNGI